MSGKTFHFESLVRPEECDNYGHMNHINYLIKMEEARWAMGDATEMSKADVEREQVGPIVMELDIRFHRECLAGETIRIETKYTEYRKKVGKIEQKIFRPSGELASTGHVTAAMLDMQRRKLVAPKPRHVELLGLAPVPK